MAHLTGPDRSSLAQDVEPDTGQPLNFYQFIRKPRESVGRKASGLQRNAPR